MKEDTCNGFLIDEDILQELDDNKMKLQSLSSSRFVGFFQTRVREWEVNLSNIDELVSV